MKKFTRYLIFAGVLIVSGVVSLWVNQETTRPKMRVIHFKAQKYSYDPHRVVVNQGDTLKISLESLDVTHGFYLEGYNITAYTRAQFPYFWVKSHTDYDEEIIEEELAEDEIPDEELYDTVTEYIFVAERTGKFRYRCSVTCGTLHPFMQGELIVKPNHEYALGFGLSVGVLIGLLIIFAPVKTKSTKADKTKKTEATVKETQPKQVTS